MINFSKIRDKFRYTPAKKPAVVTKFKTGDVISFMDQYIPARKGSAGKRRKLEGIVTDISTKGGASPLLSIKLVDTKKASGTYTHVKAYKAKLVRRSSDKTK